MINHDNSNKTLFEFQWLLRKAEAEKIFTKFPNSFHKKRNRFLAFIRPEDLILRRRQTPSFWTGLRAPLPSTSSGHWVYRSAVSTLSNPRALERGQSKGWFCRNEGMNPIVKNCLTPSVCTECRSCVAGDLRARNRSGRGSTWTRKRGRGRGVPSIKTENCRKTLWPRGEVRKPLSP
jgi:hypothetical protein